MKDLQIKLIWAQTESGVIGAAGDMPWHLPEDLAFFKKTTTGYPVLMGRRTWDSIPAPYRPFPGRPTFVLTSDDEQATTIAEAGGLPCRQLSEAWERAAELSPDGTVWVVGGGQLYRDTLANATEVVRTVIRGLNPDGDTFAPELDPSFQLISSDPAAGPESPQGWHRSRSGVQYRMEVWRRSC